MHARSHCLAALLMVLAACTPAPQRSGELVSAAPVQENSRALPDSGPWYWVGGTRDGEFASVADPSRYLLELGSAGSMQLRADCNQGRANYTAGADGSFVAGPVGLTKMGCPPDSQDREFVAAITAARHFETDAGWLRLSADAQSMLFARSPVRSLRVYDCGQGAAFAVAFGDGNVALLVDGLWQVLAAVPAAAGTRHAGGGWELAIQGEAVKLKGPAPRSDCRSRG